MTLNDMKACLHRNGVTLESPRPAFRAGQSGTHCSLRIQRAHRCPCLPAEFGPESILKRFAV
jgi:hypothetical protein